MARPSPIWQRIETLLFALAVFAGITIRLWRLDGIPGGLDIDESAILFWGAKFWTESSWWAYAPEGAAWENLPGVFFSLVHRLFGLPERIAPTLLCFAEMGLVFALARRWMGSRTARFALAVMALCPWHIFYSRIVGTCTGLALFLVWALWAKEETGRTRLLAPLRHAVGMLYYTPYRLVMARLFVESVALRQWRRALRLTAGIALAALAVLVSASPFREFFTRGSYNFSALTHELPAKIWATWSAPFLPLSQNYFETGPGFVTDRVHGGLAVASVGHPALGWGLSLMCLVGIATALGLAWRRRDELPNWVKTEGTFLALVFCALSLLGPQLSRLLTFLPLLVLFAAWGWQHWEKYLPAVARLGLVLAVLGTTAWSTSSVFNRYADRKLMDPHFFSYHKDVSRWLADRPAAENTYLVAVTGYQAGRYWASRARGYQFIPPIQPEEVANLLKGFYVGAAQEVVLPGNTLETAQYAARLRGLADSSTELPIVVEGEMVGRRLTLHWGTPRVAGLSPH